MTFTVYVIRSKEGIRYIGYSSVLDKRLSQHNSGISKFTRRDSGWHLVYREEFKTRAEAMKREKWLKSGIGREYLDRMVKEGDPSGSQPPAADRRFRNVRLGREILPPLPKNVRYNPGEAIMKNAVVGLTIFLIAIMLSGCAGPTIYVSPNFGEYQMAHKRLAILPFSVSFDAKKLPKEYTGNGGRGGKRRRI